MSTSAQASRLLKLVNAQRVPKGTDTALFKAFIRSAAPQIRSAFLVRHNDVEIFEILLGLFTGSQVRKTSKPHVQISTSESGIVIQSHMPDQPFIVDTVLLTLRMEEIPYQSGFNLVLGMGRNEKGELESVDAPADELESLIYVETEGTENTKTLKKNLENGLKLAQATVADFGAIGDLIRSTSTSLMKEADASTTGQDDLLEAAAFCRWMLADNFVFMGAIHGDTRLGIAKPSFKKLNDMQSLENWGDTSGLVQIRKAETESMVHRAGRKDEIRIQRKDGSAILIQGLFTYRAVTQPSRHVPILRRTLAEILDDQDSKPTSYRYKGIANVFDSLPTEFLFTTQADEIATMIERVLEAEQEQRPRAYILQKENDGTTFVLAAMPSGRWSDQVRSNTQAIIEEATSASYCDHGVFVGRYGMMLVHYYLTGTRLINEEEASDLANDITDIATSWQDRVLSALNEEIACEQAEALVLKYGHAFEDMYQQMTTPVQTARDVQLLDAVLETQQVIADVVQDNRGRVNLRIYQPQNILLSEMLPVIDNFGLVVADQFADPVSLADGTQCGIDTFRLQGMRSQNDAAIIEHAHELVEAVEMVFKNRMTNDSLNHLLLAARLPWIAVDMIRAYLGYARQLGLRYTRARVCEIMLAQPELATALWQYFHARFDPELSGDRQKAMADAKEKFEERLRTVRARDQDVTFRTVFNLIESTLRTNLYRTDKLDHYLSFKIDCAKVWQMPEPRMSYEVYVHHPEMEGVHLRGGKIARGGIRWSDREDYRVEILGLVTTQMVKNVLIVPEGAKGGFFLKKTYSDHKTRRAEADRLYTFLIRGLLDTTDNIVDGKVVHPPNVVRHDGPDTYMVVAADKGTAHLSDTANGVAQSYGFWLGDAFASGGSNGYDHKKVGITARGAWKTCQRHFAEMGLNPYKEEFTCVGIGDTGGDVFGNGVIESKHMRLLAAFNHKHVFIDPNPDAAVSYKERLRLFKAVQGWEGYNEDLISKGGGIFSRQAKSIKLSPEIKDLLGVMSDELAVDAVIRLILRIPCDLLWNGGIGTYVKSSDETHQDVGDATNDGLRINANELRCKIIGEGGNLGLTQAGRIEYAMKGGRANTDAIDNSGGVDMSDHEVNLKILLTKVLEDGKLTTEKRNILLEKLTETVADLVLDNSDTHANQLSLDQIRSARDPLFFSRAMDWACNRSNTTRAALNLPNNDDLARRAQLRQGLTRPELAVLAAHTKIHIFNELLEADTAEIPKFDERVQTYFPAEIRKKYSSYISDHMLHQSIGMTVLITEIVGDSGLLFFPMLQEWTGASSAAIARAWLLAMDMVNANQIRSDIDNCDASFEAKYKAWIEVQNGIAAMCAFSLTAGESGLVGDPVDTIQEVLKQLPRVRGAAHQEQLQKMASQHTDRGIPANIAQKIAALTKLTIAREIALIHNPNDRVNHTIIRYISVGEATGILPALRAMRIQQTSGPWDQVALAIMRNRFFLLMRQLYQAIPLGPEVRLGVNRIKRRLIRKGPLGQLAKEMEALLGAQPDTAMLLVAEERIRASLASGLGSVDVTNGKPKVTRTKSPSPTKSKGASASPANAK